MTVDYTKLIFWLLSLLAVVMTGIGGSAASHLVNQVDVLSIEVGSLSGQIIGFEETRKDNERRLQSIEDKLDYIRTKQNLQAEK